MRFISVLFLVFLWLPSLLAQGYKLPVATSSNYITERHDVSVFPKYSKLNAAQKEQMKRFKKEYNASKAEFVQLPDGGIYLRLIDAGKRLMIVTTEGKSVSTGSNLPWAIATYMVKVKGDPDNYYFEQNVSHPSIGDYKVISGTDGEQIISDYVSLSAYPVDGKVFFQIVKKAGMGYALVQAHPAMSLLYVLSGYPFVALDAINGQTATDNILGRSISLPTAVKPKRIESAEGEWVDIATSQCKGSRNYGKCIKFDNSGYLVNFSSYFNDPVVMVSETSATVMGKSKKGTLVEIGSPLDENICLSVYDPNGAKLVDMCKKVMFSEPEQTLYYFVKNGDRLVEGAINLADTTINISPKFDHVRLAQNADGKWLKLVNVKAFDPTELYDESKEYTVTYRNEGEEFYSRQWYALAYSFLRNTNLDELTYQDCQLAVSAYTIEGNEAILPVCKLVDQYRLGVVPDGIGDPSSEAEQAKLRLKDLYDGGGMKFNDNTLRDIADRMVALAPKDEKTMAERMATDAIMLEHDIQTMLESGIESAVAECYRIRDQKKLEEAEARRRTEEAAREAARIEAERNQAIALAFIKGFSNILQQSLTAPSRPAAGHSATPAKGKAIKGSSSGSHSASSTSDSEDDGMHQIWVNERRAELKHEIEKSLERLRNAEDNYAKNPTPNAKAAMESARRNYESYQQQYREVQ